jgi:hypothetical protein
MNKIILALLFVLLAFPAQAQTHSGPIVQASTLTITTGGTAQTLFAQTNNRGALFIENPCTTTSQGIGTLESLFVEFLPINTTTCPGTTAGAVELASCGSMNLQSNYLTPQAICVQAATTGHAFIAWQQQ